MPPAHGEAQEPVIAEDGHREGGVGNVRPALEGVVQDHHVARAERLLAVLVDRFLGGEVHRRHVDRTARRLGDEADVRIVDGVGVIEDVAQDRRERGLLQHLAHALAAEIEVAAQDLEGHRIEIPDLRCVVVGSVHCPDSSCAPVAPARSDGSVQRDQQVAAAIDRRLRARRQDSLRMVVVYNGGAGDGDAGVEPLAGVDRHIVP